MIDIQQIERLARSATPGQLMAQAKFRCAADESAVLEMVELIRELAGALDALVNEVAGCGLIVKGHLCGYADTEAASAVLEKARRAGVEGV